MTNDKVLVQSSKNRKAYKKILTLIYGAAFVFTVFFSLSSAITTSQLDFFIIYFAVYFLLIFSIAIVLNVVSKKIFKNSNVVVSETKIVASYGLKSQISLPIDSINSVTLNSKLLSEIGFNCAVKTYKIAYIENRKEIFDIVNTLISEMSVDKKSSNFSSVSRQSENTDIEMELKKFKSLLDNNLISQEEYEAKKKQLLNL